MSSVFINHRLLTRLLPTVVAVCVAPIVGTAQPRGRPIEFSAPRGASLQTNLDDVDGKKLQDSLLKQKLREDTFRPSSFINSGDSLSGVLSMPYVPPAAPPVQSRRTRDLLDRQKNWIFLSPDDFAANPGLDEALGLSEYEVNGLKKKDLTVMERFYQRLEHENDPTAKLPGSEKNKRDKEDDSTFGANSPSASEKQDPSRDPRITRTENAFKRIFDSNPSGDILARDKDGGFLSDLLGKPDADSFSGFSGEYKTAQKLRMEEFRKLLESHPSVDAAASSSLSPALTKPGELTPRASWETPVPPAMPVLPTATLSASPLGSTTPGVYATPGSTPVNQPTRAANPFVPHNAGVSPISPLPKRQF